MQFNTALTAVAGVNNICWATPSKCSALLFTNTANAVHKYLLAIPTKKAARTMHPPCNILFTLIFSWDSSRKVTDRIIRENSTICKNVTPLYILLNSSSFMCLYPFLLVLDSLTADWQLPGSNVFAGRDGRFIYPCKPASSSCPDYRCKHY